MQISTHSVATTCAICDRSLLTGERAVRYAPQGGGYLDVCPLCQEIAVEYGWVKEGTPTTPTVPAQRRRRGSWWAQIFGPVRSTPEETVASEPILRRLTEPELAMVEAADIFNASDYRRTIGGVAKSLGEPRASILQLSGVNNELGAARPPRGAGPRARPGGSPLQELERPNRHRGARRPGHRAHLVPQGIHAATSLRAER
jgi:hypothetical protein